jgi:class I fructose-bisphosphate aldolase
MGIGKQMRIKRIINASTGKMVLIPLDHGIVGTVLGIEDPKATVSKIASGGADSVLFNIGLANSVWEGFAGNCGSIYNLTNCVTDKSQQTILAGVEQAIRLGADAVSVQMTLGSPYEAVMIKNYQKIYDDCARWDMPVLLMSYFNKDAIGSRTLTDCITQCARVGAELGADIVKIAYPGDKKSLSKVVESCPIPVVVAGGTKKDDVTETLRMVKDIVDAGANGIAMGRNVWQYREPEKLVKALSKIIHEDATVDEAKGLL